MIQTDPPTRLEIIVLASQFASVALVCAGVFEVNKHPLVAIALILLGGLILIATPFVGKKNEK